MDEPAPSRKLTAILAADVAGYSRMMRADQSGTIARLAACRGILDEAVLLNQGRIANTAGDSVLAEFNSVVDALHCAIEIQGALARENERLPSGIRMQFRIGVHTGDVFVRHGGDLLGDGVNVAARLQSLAPPGGIYTSETVREQVRGILSLRFDDRGQHHLKNIAKSVRVYAVAAAGPGLPRRRERQWPIRSVSMVGAALALVLAIGSAGALWWLRPPWLAPWLPKAAVEAGQTPTAAIAPQQRSASAPVAPSRTAAKPAAAPASSTGAADATELAVWQSATAQGSQAALEEYLRQYPAGHFAELARTQIQALKSVPASSAAPASPPAPVQVANALAQGVPFDCPKPGTVIGLSDGQRLTFGSRAGFHCHAVDNGGKTMDEYAGFVSISALPSLAAADLERLWPLKERDEVVFATQTPELFSGTLTQPWASNRYRVVGTEHLHLPAGDFDTVIVERRLQGRNAYQDRARQGALGDLDVTQKFWYAPKIAHVVKVVTERGSSTYAASAFPDHVEATEVTVP